jgi:hypothetical protein
MGAEPKRVLIVSTVELGGPAIESLVGDDAVTMVVVPPVRQSRLQWLANDEDRAREVAQRASERLAAETPGMTVAAEAGDSDPALAIEDALRKFDANEIVVVARPEEEATWLEGRVAGNGAAEIDGVPVRRASVAADGSVSFDESR